MGGGREREEGTYNAISYFKEIKKNNNLSYNTTAAMEKNRLDMLTRKLNADLRRLFCIINLVSVNRENICSLTEEEMGKCLMFFLN